MLELRHNSSVPTYGPTSRLLQGGVVAAVEEVVDLAGGRVAASHAFGVGVASEVALFSWGKNSVSAVFFAH